MTNFLYLVYLGIRTIRLLYALSLLVATLYLWIAAWRIAFPFDSILWVVLGLLVAWIATAIGTKMFAQFDVIRKNAPRPLLGTRLKQIQQGQSPDRPSTRNDDDERQRRRSPAIARAIARSSTMDEGVSRGVQFSLCDPFP